LITVRTAWRSAWYQCDDERIINQDTTGEISALSCYEGCSGSLPLVSNCSDYSITDNWSQVEGKITHAFNETVPIKLG